jgi:aryl-alcohol dehydrogenase-like predicted oxidoreductase
MQVSPVIYGGIVGMDETQEDSDRYVAHAVEHGVNYFDVAPTYGNAQERLGESLRPYRKGVYLACKTMCRDAEGARRELLHSLKTLHTDHFDVYQVHAIASQQDVDQAFGAGGAMETLLWARREGLVRNVGFSAHDEDAALVALGLFDFATVLFPMNWALGLVRGWGNRISALAAERGIGLLAMKTQVERGWLPGDDRGRYPKSWCKPISGNEALGVAAMKYGLSKGAATLVPPGNFEHLCFMLDHIDECLKDPLAEAELELLKIEAEKVRDHLIF